MKYQKALLLLFILTTFSFLASAQPDKELSVKVDPQTGKYSVSSPLLEWTFSGDVGNQLQNVKASKGKDAIGAFHAVSFDWKSNNEYTGNIRWYTNSPVVIFSLTTPIGANGAAPVAFPDFSAIPGSLYHFSYHDDVFSHPEFKLNETSTPWLLFDGSKKACVISPASDFIVAKITGDGTSKISSELNPEVTDLPANFTHKTIMVFDRGIRKTWDDWGRTLRKLYNRQRPASDADDVLKYYGYWTDNGADYYYNYDTTKGYAQTLLDLRQHYKENGIPMAYMQLDSWWYEKSIYDPEGKPDADHKNRNLPKGPWNRYGGLMEYRADPFLFPDGLAAFHDKLGIPLITHNRWIDPMSPYHKMFKISGYAGVGAGYWRDIMDYIKESGVICYEQDWLNEIYLHTPKMASDISVGNAFTDGMADAAKADGLDLQYCMGMPRYFLQGVKYNNLTTIRTSGDRFEPRKWMPFIFTSQFGYEMGIWPWCDVFKSSEKGNMIVADLSAGPVGTGDALGKENKENIMLTCRNDGVLIKPDVPLLPMDQDYVEMARNEGKPLLAYTYTKHNNITTYFVFAFADKNANSTQFSFTPSDMGANREVAVYDPMHDKLQIVKADEPVNQTLPDDKYTYYIVAPVTSSGIAFLGDANTITSTGKKRIADINSKGNTMKVKVVFAKGESKVTLRGYSKQAVQSDEGTVTQDSKTHLFMLTVAAPSKGDSETVTINAK